jgi:hypothetical protein
MVNYKMQVNLSRRRIELISQGLNCLISRYDGALALNPTNVVLLAAQNEVREFLKIVEARLEPLPELEDIEL